MKKNMESRRGVALAEVVIALVVITIISVATLSVMFSSVQIENKTIVAMDVRNQAENAIECYQYADGNRNTFFACMKRIAKNENCGFINYRDDDKYVCVFDKGGYKIKIIWETDEVSYITFEATYKNDGKEIYSFSFPSTEGGNAQ